MFDSSHLLKKRVDESNKPVRCSNGHKLPVEYWGKKCPYCENIKFYPEHVSSRYCWCEPELDYVDIETGNEVWIHREVH